MKKFAKINLALAILMLPVCVFSAMSSTNYYIYADSVETGGGLSTGGVYSLEDTLGEGIISQTGATTYNINAGYQAMVLGSLSMNISNNSITLGDLSTTTVSTATTTVTISTDAATGYFMSIQTAGANPLIAVSDGEVTAGQEEYGIAVVGSDAVTTTDRGIVGGLPLAQKLISGTGVNDLVFKASISPTTISGNRSQSIVIGVSANF
jgi:hypothetical protein